RRAGDAVASVRDGLEAFERDRPFTLLAIAVGARRHAFERVLDLGECVLSSAAAALGDLSSEHAVAVGLAAQLLGGQPQLGQLGPLCMQFVDESGMEQVVGGCAEMVGAGK